MKAGDIEPTSTLVSQISATILYKLLQNVPKQHNNSLVNLLQPLKEDEVPIFNDFNYGSPVISVGVEECNFTDAEQVQELAKVESYVNNKDESKSSTSSNGETHFVSKYSNLSASESVKMNPKKRLLQRHLLEKGSEDSKCISDNGSETASRYSVNNNAPFGRGKNGKPLTRTPFIPSYMDPKSGPFFCKVCGYKASGLHYRVMACEGCKGFFRRSVQKKLKYVCKMNNNCPINSDNRTKCQQCRWVLCLEAGMDVASVLNEDERRTKNDLIKANRQKRKQAHHDVIAVSSVGSISRSTFDVIDKTQSDEQMKAILETIDVVTKAFESAFIKDQTVIESVPMMHGFQCGQEFTNRVTIFAQLLPGIIELSQITQSTLLHSRCLDIICLCTAFTFNRETQQLKLPSGRLIDSAFVDKYKHVEPLWYFAKRTADYQLSRAEMAVLTGLAFLVNNTLDSMESLYNQLLAALDHLMAGQPLRNSKLLIVIFSDLQVLTTRLFELRAPLGHQLLFDVELAPVKRESTAPSSSQHINIRPHPSADDRSNNAINRTTPHQGASGPSSSIFAFSYGDKQL